MLSLLNSSTSLNTFSNTKCGEVYCHTMEHFSIICTFCELKTFEFGDFLLHFKNVHLDVSDEKPYKIVTKLEPEQEQLQDINQLTATPDIDFDVLGELKTSPAAALDWKIEEASVDDASNVESDAENDSSKDEDYVPKVLKILPQVTKKITPPVEYKCKECEKSYKLERMLERHFNLHHNKDKVYKCPRCEVDFHSERELSIHMQNVHAGFPCSQCDKTYKTKEALHHHSFNHRGERSFVCDFENCSKSFLSPKSLSCHKRIVHFLERNYVCESCGFRTKSKSALVVHNRTHTGEKPFVCEVCDRRFASQSLLCEHKAMHLTNRPHKCEVCGASFARAKALYHHKHLHLGIKKFLCKICGKAYAQAAGLSGHMRQHKSEQF